MSGPHPLNQAVVAQTLHDLRNGQLQRCLAMGFTEELLKALQQPRLASVLSNSRLSWCSIRIDPRAVQYVLKQLHSEAQDNAQLERMLRLGASTEMINQFYGLSHQEIATRRSMLGMTTRKGRWPALSETQEITLWKRWQAQLKDRQVAQEDANAMLDITLTLAQEMDLPASLLWTAISGWVEQKQKT